MPEHPLYVSIVWHMHQPYYRDLLTGEISMPWVRLHAAKDYLHMGEVLAAHPRIHLTINMVPALTEQMLAWARGDEADRLVQLAEQSDWAADEKRLILNLAFSINWDNILRRYPRYVELLDRRPAALAQPDTFNTQDYRDLLAWFNLGWIDPNWLVRDASLARLVAKRRDFSVEDIATIHAKQREIAGQVLPLYRQLIEAGQLEVSTSPFFHPVLPLLIDTTSALRASPGLPLPGLRAAVPDDAAAQLHMAVESHRAHFGRRPAGLWPSEGAVSYETLPLISAAGFTWMATDEAILGRSLGRPFTRDGSNMIDEPRALYRPYRVLAGSELGPCIIFRDHELSDRIGFLYQHLPGQQAAEDMVYRLLEIRRRLNDAGTPYLVSIILDGENCWEYYEHNGDNFLHAFYGLLVERPELRAVTVEEYVGGIAQRPAATLARLATGSWIDGDLTTWIGEPEHNRAWESLARVRAHLAQRVAEKADRPGLAAAWRALYAAEGSDWFWWYSHRNRSDQDALYDQLLRHDLAAVYIALGEEPPTWLEKPIRGAAVRMDSEAATGQVTPRLAAEPYPGAEWALAAILRPANASNGAMQRADTHIERVFAGYDERSLYLRVELRERPERYEIGVYLGGAGDGPANQRLRGQAPGSTATGSLAVNWLILCSPDGQVPFLLHATGHGQWESVGPVQASRGEKVLELALPLTTVGLAPGAVPCLLVTLSQRGAIAAQLPERGMFPLPIGPARAAE